MRWRSLRFHSRLAPPSNLPPNPNPPPRRNQCPSLLLLSPPVPGLHLQRLRVTPTWVTTGTIKTDPRLSDCYIFLYLFFRLSVLQLRTLNVRLDCEISAEEQHATGQIILMYFKVKLFLDVHITYLFSFISSFSDSADIIVLPTA